MGGVLVCCKSLAFLWGAFLFFSGLETTMVRLHSFLESKKKNSGGCILQNFFLCN